MRTPEADEFARQHPEFKDYDPPRLESGETDRNDPQPPIRFGGKRVITGYEPMPGDGGVVPLPERSYRSLEERRLAVKLEKLLVHLSPARADLLRRWYWERQTQEQIAADLGLSQQAVNQRLRTAEKQLRKVYLSHPDIEVLNDEL